MANIDQPKTMTAAIFTSTSGGFEKHMSLSSTAPRPPPLKDGETLVRVAYAALNPADYKIAEMPLFGGFMASTPASPAMDFSGRVAETRNPALHEGQLVFGRVGLPRKFGSAAEYTVAPKEACVPLPATISLTQGATLGTAALTAWQCVAPHIRAAAPGARVLVNGGSGGSGTWGVQFATALGARVTSTCSTGNVELVTGLGAKTVHDYKKVDVADALVEQAQREGPFDLVFDAVGSPEDLYRAADRFARPGAPYVQIGAEHSFAGYRALMRRMLMPRVLGNGSRPYTFLAVADKAKEYEEMGGLVAQGKANGIVDSVFQLRDARQAYEKLKTNRARGKILIEVAGESV